MSRSKVPVRKQAEALLRKHHGVFNVARGFARTVAVQQELFAMQAEKAAERCDYFDELEFREADMAFDAGEFSAGFHDHELRNEPCGKCKMCKEMAEHDAAHPGPESHFDERTATTLRP